MIDKRPRRPPQHDIATISERYFESLLPAHWVTETPKNDYGIDKIVHVFENGQATRYQFIVQLKSSQESTPGKEEIVQFPITTYNFLMDKLDVAILIKYVADQNEAYWIFLRDIPTPAPKVDSFTIRIPKAHTLSQIDWQQILARIRPIMDGKHDAGKNL